MFVYKIFFYDGEVVELKRNIPVLKRHLIKMEGYEERRIMMIQTRFNPAYGENAHGPNTVSVGYWAEFPPEIESEEIETQFDSPASLLPGEHERIARWLIPARDREEILGDLQERFDRHAEKNGEKAAHHWLTRRIALHLALPFLWKRLNDLMMKTIIGKILWDFFTRAS